MYPIVLVSPHIRTIQTAVNMLQSHPQKDKLTLKLEPQLKEVVYTAGDVPLSSHELIEFV